MQEPKPTNERTTDYGDYNNEIHNDTTSRRTRLHDIGRKLPAESKLDNPEPAKPGNDDKVNREIESELNDLRTETQHRGIGP